MGNTLKIHNWRHWQSYRSDRGQPPWIKVHRCIMRDVDWVSLTDAQRGQLVAMWLLAADNDGVIPASPDIIKKLCFLDSKLDLQVFIEKGFIDGDVDVTSERRQCVTPETETETEKRRKECQFLNSKIEKLKSDFDEARKLFKGTKRGLEPEWENFKKKHKDYKEIIPLLKPAIENQIVWRQADNRYWKNFQTWINQSCWTEETTIVSTDEPDKSCVECSKPYGDGHKFTIDQRTKQKIYRCAECRQK